MMMGNKILFCSFYLLAVCGLCIQALSHCEADDQHCLLVSKQTSVIAQYEAEVTRYRSMLAATNCTICNLNGQNPCQNGGICTPLDKYVYVCDCPDNFAGKYCETEVTCGPRDCGTNAICTVFNHKKVCSCPMGFTGNPKIKCDQKITRACIRGDPHYSTFDGSFYDYMGTCPYVITQTNANDQAFKVIGYNEFRNGNTRVSYITSFTFFSQGSTFDITNTLALYVNGIRKFYPHYYPSRFNPQVKITKSCGYVKIRDYSSKALIEFRNYQLCISLPQSPQFYGTGKLGGVLGDMDGNCQNDYALQNGTVINVGLQCDQGSSVDAAVFADSWVTDPNYNNCVMGKIIQNNTNCNTPVAQTKCQPIRDAISGTGPFAKCQAMTQPVIQQYFEDCVFDVCLGVEPCEMLASFATSCLDQIPFVMIDNWRSPTNCPWPCPPHSSYSLQTPTCQNTCADPNYANSSSCQDGHQEGCKCWAGYYLDSVGDSGFDFACRRIEDCGCTDSYGNYYPPNTNWLNNNCTLYNQCSNGTFSSQPVSCSINGKCVNVIGDPECRCKPGYSGDGFACADINECNNPTVCGADQGHGVCVNTPGSYYCNCIAPYGGDDCAQYLPTRHCADLYHYHGIRSNGVYNITIAAVYSTKDTPVWTEVYCDMESNGGGWTLASHGNNTAGKSYNEYLAGFGDPRAQQVWLGLDNLHAMTNHTVTSLRVIIERCRINSVPDTTRECTYPTFSVLGAEKGYPVYIPEYCTDGNETTFDGFDGWVRWPKGDIGPVFTAIDKDSTPYNCSAEYKGTGWWYYASKQGALCGAANLNGLRQACNDNYLPQGYLTWHYDPVEDARMYLRPKDFPNYDAHPHFM